ncbi:alanine--tRNA ligase [Candidatus Pacearchaeota archaeon]|nr:alanine--tRNA ligase [Candidatus Pacearchaeota archaeon]
MERKEFIKRYLEFFHKKGHKIIPSASLIPEHDPTVLFTTAGMHPLVPFLLGQPHPQGKRLVNAQKCIRTTDIGSVGDSSHLTFFEMLGNWSLGDYWKKEAIEWSFEFLIKELKFKPGQLHVTVFAGDGEAPKDGESARIWQNLGIPGERIYWLGKSDNFWGPAGMTGPCGPCTEMFIDTGKKPCSKTCGPGCSCGKYFEIWNDVFMEYNKTAEGKYSKLKQKNVDTGMGVERTITMLQGKKNVYETSVFLPVIKRIKEIAGIKNENGGQENSIRIIADHLKAAVFILGDEKRIHPGKKDQGYILRGLIRKAIRHGNILGIKENFTEKIAEEVIRIYQEDYSELSKNRKFIIEELEKEEALFRGTLERGLKEFENICKKSKNKILCRDAFLLYQSFGFPIEMTCELADEKDKKVDVNGFKKEFERHQEISRQGSEKKFKSGLADTSEQTTRLHTATHILGQALREVLGSHIQQKGSNITAERLRFDFSHDKKMTDEEIKKTESIVNEKIEKAMPVKREEMTLEEARKKGALAFFDGKYGEKVSVYSIGKAGQEFSKEVCAGPHVQNTKELGKFKIVKEEAVAAGVRRIKAVLVS